MNDNYYNLIREVTEKYDYEHRDKVKYNKNDEINDKAYKDLNYKITIKDSPHYGDMKIRSYIARGIPLRREVMFTPAVPVIIDCLGIIVTDKRENLIHSHFYSYEAKLKIFDNRHETLKKLFRTIGDSKHEPEEVFKDEIKNSGFKIDYHHKGDSRVRIHNYALLGKRIYRIKLHQWYYCFDGDYDYKSNSGMSRYTKIRLSIHEPDIEDITDKCLAASGNKKPSKK